MRKIFQKLFPRGRSAAEKLRAKQLREAQVMELQHQAAADYHQAMANMYRDQAVRLVAGIREVNIRNVDMVDLRAHTHTMGPV